MKRFLVILVAVGLAVGAWAGVSINNPYYEIRSVSCNVDTTENNVRGISFSISAEVYDNSNGSIMCDGGLLQKENTFGGWEGVIYNPAPQDNYTHSNLDLRSESGYIVYGKTQTVFLCENNDVIKNFKIFIPHSVITHPRGHVEYQFSFTIRNATKTSIKHKAGGFSYDYTFSLDWPEEWPKKVRIEDTIEEPKAEPKVSISSEVWNQIDKAEWQFKPRSNEIGETNQSYVVSVIVEQDIYSKRNRLKVRESISGWVPMEDLDELSGNYEIGFIDDLLWGAWVSFKKEGYDLTKTSQAFITLDDLGDIVTSDICEVIEVRGDDGEFCCAEKCVLQTIAQFSKKYQVINTVKADKKQRPNYVYQLGSTLVKVGECNHIKMRRHNPNSLTKYTTSKDWRKECKTDPAHFGAIIRTHKLPVVTQRYDMGTQTINESRREFTVYMHNTDNNKADFENISIGDGSGYYYELLGIGGVTLHILGRVKDRDIKALHMDQILVSSPSGRRIITNSQLAQYILTQLNSNQNHSTIKRYSYNHFYYKWDLDVDGLMSEIEKPE